MVERIDLPNGEHPAYGGAGGMLATVDHADGTRSLFTYASDAAFQADTIAFDDAAAGGTHRRKTVYSTQGQKTTTWLDGTTLPRTVTKAGETTLYTCDGLQRRVAVTRSTDGSTDLTRATAYDASQWVRSTADPYGRSTYYASDINNRVAHPSLKQSPEVSP